MIGEEFDELKWKNDDRILQKTHEDKEAFLLSTEVLSFKNVKKKKLKLRNLLLTKNFMYFISEFNFCMINRFTIKRKIPIIQFTKITMDSSNRECVLHIAEEDDIYLSAGPAKHDQNNYNLKKFQRILKELDKAFTNQKSSNLRVFKIVNFDDLTDRKNMLLSSSKER